VSNARDTVDKKYENRHYTEELDIILDNDYTKSLNKVHNYKLCSPSYCRLGYILVIAVRSVKSDLDTYNAQVDIYW
jgi:hypothetical protein